MEDWLTCQISPLVQYRQNQTEFSRILRSFLGSRVSEVREIWRIHGYVYNLLTTTRNVDLN